MTLKTENSMDTAEQLYELYPYNLLTQIVDDIYSINLRDFFNAIQTTLSPREKDIIEYLYKDRLTLDQVEKKYGVTRERIRQVSEKAKRKMQSHDFIYRVTNISRGEYEKLEHANGILSHAIVRSLDWLSTNNIDLSKSIIERPLEEILIDELDLSVRSHNCLLRAKVKTIQDLLNMSEKELKSVRYLGRQSFDEILQKLHEKGYTFPFENKRLESE
ncbi:hypothetical protein KG091_04545 [Carnobacteriaceae bacterium zg-ZUI78]|nr:hypothetical protein [Carnobacteriaceae bacterium zg-ZUI78]